MAEKAIRLGGESTAAAITQAVQELYPEHSFTADDIVGRTDIPARRVNTALTILQAQGYLKELPGRRFTAAVRFDQDR